MARIYESDHDDKWTEFTIELDGPAPIHPRISVDSGGEDVTCNAQVTAGPFKTGVNDEIKGEVTNKLLSNCILGNGTNKLRIDCNGTFDTEEYIHIDIELTVRELLL